MKWNKTKQIQLFHENYDVILPRLPAVLTLPPPFKYWWNTIRINTLTHTETAWPMLSNKYGFDVAKISIQSIFWMLLKGMCSPTHFHIFHDAYKIKRKWVWLVLLLLSRAELCWCCYCYRSSTQHGTAHSKWNENPFHLVWCCCVCVFEMNSSGHCKWQAQKRKGTNNFESIQNTTNSLYHLDLVFCIFVHTYSKIIDVHKTWNTLFNVGH